MRRDAWTVVLLLLTTLVWGSAFTAIKKIVVVLEPVDLAFLRFALAGILFGALLVGMRARGRPLPALGRRQWALVVLLGFFGVVGYHVSLNGGEAVLTRTGSEDVAAVLSSFLISMTPAFTLLLAPSFVGERIGGRRALGALIAFVGAGILVLWGRGDLIGRDALSGALLVLVAPFSWAIYTLVVKRFFRGIDPVAVTAYSMIAGTLLLVPLVSPGFPRDVTRLNAGLWGWVLVLSVGATFAGYLIWNYALSHWDAGRTATFVYLVPLFGLLVARVQAHERITPQIILGGGLILFGVWWANTFGKASGRAPASTTRVAPALPNK